MNNQTNSETGTLEVKGDSAEKSGTDQRVPSYVGLSCAVSGYRSINKYDAAIREGFCAQNSPQRIALSRGDASKGPPISSDGIRNEDGELKPRSTEYAVPDASGERYLHFEQSDCFGMDSPQRNMNGHSSIQCSRVIKVEQFSSVNSPSSSPLISEKGLGSYSNGTSKEDGGKSFVQQRIERLYGPAALGMAFQAKRALLERYKEKERVESEGSHPCKDSPQGLPSVFRHLRPEFRHQLPVKPRVGFGSKARNGFDHNEISLNSITNTEVTNGHRVRHIPIQMEEELEKKIETAQIISKDTTDDAAEKSWKTLSRDLQAIPAESKTGVDSQIAVDVRTLDLNKNINSSTIEEKRPTPSRKEVDTKDGNYFLKVVAVEVSSLEPPIEQIDSDLKEMGDNMSEEVRGKLLAASGKAKLLINQKIEQFKGLCFKNISKSTTEEFPTTDEDLAGFWDMVSIQVENVRETIREVDLIRKNDWKEVQKVSAPEPAAKKPLTRRTKNSAAPASKTSEKDLAKQKANEDRRKQMREALNAKRKQASKLRNSEPEEVEIFIPKQG